MDAVEAILASPAVHALSFPEFRHGIGSFVV
jgi:hypothetical protein